MGQHRINALIDLLSHSDLTELSLTERHTTLILVRDATGTTTPRAMPTPISVVPLPSADSAELVAMPVEVRPPAHELCAPLYGIFHTTPAPETPPFVTEGDMVAKGQPLALIEAMKMFHTLEADSTGSTGP